ncbi:hypothetical protein SAMN02910339_00442 [Lachnospiraceae bacterium YSD2013]|nr:hypothetical protein SAMN02910339_00442 [Lachnospiraceae bacterium YSD2013]
MKSKAMMALKILIAFAIPFAISALYCLVRGVTLIELYLPASYNNDCVFYYKLVDAIVTKGGPTGFFGFNESHAMIGGFAAWSPLLLMPWALWGVIFGWTYSSVIWCNLTLFGIALAVFVGLAEVDFKTLGALFVMLLLFPGFSINLMNVLPEIVVVSVMLVYLGFAVRAAAKGPRISYIVAMYIIAAYLTVTRPYMLLLMIIPTYYLGKQTKKSVAALCFVLVSGVSFLGNVLVGHFFTAAYFEPLFNTDFVKEFMAGHFSMSFWMAVSVFKSMTKGIAGALVDAFSYGLTMGTQYVVAIVTAIAAFVMAVRKGENKYGALCWFHFTSVMALLLAIVFFLRKTNEGGRHIWAFAVIGIVIVCACGFDKLGIAVKAISAALLIVFCTRGAIVPTDYDIPMPNEAAKENVEFWKTVFEDKNVFASDAKGYDNTVMWVFIDYAGETGVVTEYNELYALPSGMGISCCYPDYVISNFDNLQSKFIVADSRGKVAALCAEKGLKVVGEHENVIMYQRY